MQRETRVTNYVLAAFSAISIILMLLPMAKPVEAVKACVSYAFNPLAYYGAKGVDRFSKVPANIRHLIDADIQNQEMLAQMRQWSLIRSEAETLRAENARLRLALGLKPPAGWTGLWAHVMERDPLHWYSSLMVDAGADRGVQVNAPVLGLKGQTLVALGRVTEVGPKSSKVLLLTDDLSSAAAVLSTAAVEGLVQGQADVAAVKGGERLRMNYLQSEAVLAKGDAVLTSPTSATFPPDILIGTISGIYARDPFLMSQSIEVKPAADASSFGEVMILKPEPARTPAP